MSLAKNISQTFITRLGLIVIGTISSIILSRYLGPDGRGIIATITAITGMVVQFGNFGLHASNTFFVSKDKNLLPGIISNTAWVSLIWGLATIIITYLTILFFPAILHGISINLLLIALLAIPATFLILFLQNLLIGLNKIKIYNLIELILQFANLLVIFILLFFFKLSVNIIIVVTTISTLISGVVYYYQFKDVKKPFKFNSKLFVQMLKYGSKSYIACLLSYLIIRSDIIIVNFFKGSAETGIYSLAVQFCDLLYLLPMTSGLLLFPKIAGIANHAEKTRTTEKVSRNVLLIMLALSFASLIFIYPVIYLLYGQAFIGAVIPFIILLPGTLFLSIQTIINNDLGGRGLPAVTYISPAIGLLVNLALNIILVPRYGMVAAAATSTLAYFCMFAIITLYFKRKYHSSFKNLLLPRISEIKEMINHLFRKKNATL